MFTEFVRGKIANKTKNAAIKVATHYANVACPFFTYQPKMSVEVKKLRKAFSGYWNPDDAQY